MIHNKNFPFDKDGDDSEIIHVRASGGSAGLLRKIIFFTVTLLFIGFSAKYIYIHSRGETDQTKIPYVMANPNPYRSKPTDPGGMDIPHMDKEIYQNLDHKYEEDAERVIPTAPPEKPIAHDSIAYIIDAEEKRSKNLIPPVDSKNVKVSSANPLSSTKPKVYKIDQDGKVVVVSKDEKARIKSIDVNRILARQTPPEFWAQLGTFSKEEEATKAWQQLREKNADIVGEVQIKISKSDLGAEGVSYRLQAGPLGNEVDAKNFCKKLSEHEKSCFYVQGSAR